MLPLLRVTTDTLGSAATGGLCRGPPVDTLWLTKPTPKLYQPVCETATPDSGIIPGWGICRSSADLTPRVAYTFRATGWEDFDGNRYRGTPSDVERTHGVFVHVQNPDDSDDQHRFWAWGKFSGWAEWWVYIGALMQMHGMELADE